MALANYNAELEYSGHIAKFWNYDLDMVPEDFKGDTKLFIKRIDDTTAKETFLPSIVSTDDTGYIEIPLDLVKTSVLYVDGDKIFDYENSEPQHIWSLESADITYISGTLKLLESAGS